MNDLNKIGRISSINYKNGTAQVVYKDRDNMVTGDIPFLANEYLMPKVGDMVVVLHMKNSSKAGVIIGPIYNDDNRPGISGKNKFIKEMTDKACMKAEGGKLTISADDIVLTCSSGTATLAEIISHIRSH